MSLVSVQELRELIEALPLANIRVPSLVHKAAEAGPDGA